MTNVKWKLFHGGACAQLEKMVFPDQRRWGKKIFPALFSLIEHPLYGPILFDTGYSTHFFQATATFPYRLYPKITPVTFSTEQSALSQLEQSGYRASDIGMIILSHLHADHMAGLKDFPQATVWVHHQAWQSVKGKKGLSALRVAFLPELVPDSLEERIHLIDPRIQVTLPPKYQPFTVGYDLLQDGSLLAVDLPGHAIGQIGLFFQTVKNGTLFLIADCCWDRRSYEELLYPHRLTHLLHPSRSAYLNSLQMVHQYANQHPDAKIIPSHCQTTWAKYREK